MPQINLLVSDNLKAIRDDHPLAFLLYHRYRTLQQQERPRLFGFLSSRDCPGGFDRSLLIKEELTFSHVFGVSPTIRTRMMVDTAPAQDLFITYNKEIEKSPTPLFRKICSLDSKEHAFQEEIGLAKNMLVSNVHLFSRLAN